MENSRRSSGALPASLTLLALAASAQTATVTVAVQDFDHIASVAVIDEAVWERTVPNDAGFSAHLEDADLPAEFVVQPGSYVVAASQGTGSGQERITVEAGDDVDVMLEVIVVE